MYFAVAWSLLAAAVAGGELTGGGKVYDVTDQRQLLIDEAFFDQASNVRLRLQQAKKTGEKILWPQWPWESATLNWFSVMQDPGVVDRRPSIACGTSVTTCRDGPPATIPRSATANRATASIGASRR